MLGLRGAGSRDAELPGGPPEVHGGSQPVAGCVYSAWNAGVGAGSVGEEGWQLVTG